MNNSTSVWTGDWDSRIRDELEARGFDTLTGFLASVLTETYLDVAKSLKAAAIQIIVLQFEEAKEYGTSVQAVKDCLVRNLRECLPDGWPNVARGNFQVALALASWKTTVIGRGNCPEFEDRAEKILTAMLDGAIELGWLPESIFDPTIDQVFETFWN